MKTWLSKAISIIAIFVLIVGLSAAALPPSTPIYAQGESLIEELPSAPEVDKGHPKLESALSQLVAAQKQGQAAAFAKQRDITLEDGAVEVVVEVAQEAQIATAVEAAEGMGGRVTGQMDNLLRMRVAIPAWRP